MCDLLLRSGIAVGGSGGPTHRADVAVQGAAKADFANPHPYPTGIHPLPVNGRLAMDGNQHTGARADQALEPH